MSVMILLFRLSVIAAISVSLSLVSCSSDDSVLREARKWSPKEPDGEGFDSVQEMWRDLRGKSGYARIPAGDGVLPERFRCTWEGRSLVALTGKDGTRYVLPTLLAEHVGHYSSYGKIRPVPEIKAILVIYRGHGQFPQVAAIALDEGPFFKIE